jgi:hypothetical protein
MQGITEDQFMFRSVALLPGASGCKRHDFNNLFPWYRTRYRYRLCAPLAASTPSRVGQYPRKLLGIPAGQTH